MSCTIDDLRTEAIMVVSIGDDGEPIYYEPCEDPGTDQKFWCVGCRHDFNDWDKATAHLAGQVPVGVIA